MPRLGTLAAIIAAAFVCAPATARATTLDNTSNPMDYARLLDGGGINIGAVGTTGQFTDSNGSPAAHSDAERLFTGAPDGLGFASGVVLTTGSANAMLN